MQLILQTHIILKEPVFLNYRPLERNQIGKANREIEFRLIERIEAVVLGEAVDIQITGITFTGAEGHDNHAADRFRNIAKQSVDKRIATAIENQSRLGAGDFLAQ